MSATVTAAPTYVGVEIPQSYVLLDYHEAIDLAARLVDAAAQLDEAVIRKNNTHTSTPTAGGGRK